MKIVATTSLPAVDRPNADRWNAARSCQKLLRTPKNLGVDTFPDPLCHFGAPWRPFWILQAVRRCRRLASAPFAARLVFGSYFIKEFPAKKKSAGSRGK